MKRAEVLKVMEELKQDTNYKWRVLDFKEMLNLLPQQFPISNKIWIRLYQNKIYARELLDVIKELKRKLPRKDIESGKYHLLDSYIETLSSYREDKLRWHYDGLDEMFENGKNKKLRPIISRLLK